MTAASLRSTFRTILTPWRFHFLLILSSFAGSWAPIFARLAEHEGIPSLYLVAFRQVMAALILTPFVLHHYRAELRNLRRREIAFAAIAGFWFALHLMFGFEGLEHTSVLVSNVLIGTTPLWIALVEVSVLKNHLGKWVWIGLFVTLCGGVIITLGGSNSTVPGDNPGLGSLLSIGAAIAGSLYAIMGRESRARMPFLPYMWMLFSFGAITTLVVVFITHTPVIGYSPSGYFDLLMLVVLPQLIGHLTYNFVLRHISATYVAVIGQLGVLMSAILAFVIFAEIPGALQLPGSLAIVVGITLVNLAQTR